MHKRLIHILLLITTCWFTACKNQPLLKDFTSDGCSLFPDRSLIDAKDWCECCVEHDIAYWQGGTEAQRLAADQQLRACVLAKTDDSILADAMFNGVRVGGSPWFYNWYRWGYGWTDGRNYQPLTLEEQRMVSDKLVEYFKSNPVSPCD
ncbi:MAG: hypothetical protein ACSHYA_16895 [Opitutaceae bacterium]